MRRLPIFLVLDVSESMAGEPINNVQSGMQMLLDALMSDPYAMETVYLSVIVFAGSARVVTPLTYLLDFQPPKLPIGSGTCLTPAIKLLMKEIDSNVKKNTPESKGDWRPLVFILTDGAPNDNYTQATQEWKSKYGNKISTIAVLMGANSDASSLKALTDNVIVFKDTSKESYKAFFKWVSTSIQVSSKEVGENGRDVTLSEQIAKNMEKDLIAEQLPSSEMVEYFVIVLRCQKTKKPYFIRLVREHGEKLFTTDGAFPLEESYFEMSASGEGKQVDLESLSGSVPSCPYCGNQMLGRCGCDKWICLNNEQLKAVQCPWCERVSDYGGNVESIHGSEG